MDELSNQAPCGTSLNPAGSNLCDVLVSKRPNVQKKMRSLRRQRPNRWAREPAQPFLKKTILVL
jgi:hypothetical protein